MILTLILTLLYFALMLFIGLREKSLIKTTDDFFLASKKLPFYLACPSIIATWFGAGSLLGVSELVRTKNISAVIADPFGVALSLLIAAVFFAKKLRQLKLSTIHDLILDKYGPQLEKLTSMLTLPFYIGSLAAQLVALGLLFNAFFLVPYYLGLILAANLILIYLSLGGLWSVARTDLIQLIIFTVSLILLFYHEVTQINQTQNILGVFFRELSQIGPEYHDLYSYLPWAGMWLMTGFGALMGQDLLQRFFACEDSKTAQKSAYWACLGYLIFGSIPVLIGIAGRTNNLNLLANIQENYSQGFQSLFFLSILSITMSTADSYLLAASSIVTRHLSNKKNKNSLIYARISAFILILLASLLALFTQNIFGLIVHSSVFLFITLFVPVTFAIYQNNKTYKSSKKSAYCSIYSALITWVLFLSLNYKNLITNPDPVLYSAATLSGLASFIGFISQKIRSDFS